MHKFGINTPKNAEENFRLDGESGIDYWRKVIDKEMNTVQVALDFKE